MVGWEREEDQKRPIIEAQYEGTCDYCGDAIEVGDELTKVDESVWIHLQCDS